MLSLKAVTSACVLKLPGVTTGAAFFFQLYSLSVQLTSSKVEGIKDNPVLSALFWDPSQKVQVRIEVEAKIHNQNEISADWWKVVQGDAQKTYTSVPTPGTPVDIPEDAHEWPESYSSDHFSVVVYTALRIKVLQISRMEHFAFKCSRSSTSDKWQKTWIAP